MLFCRPLCKETSVLHMGGLLFEKGSSKSPFRKTTTNALGFGGGGTLRLQDRASCKHTLANLPPLLKPTERAAELLHETSSELLAGSRPHCHESCPNVVCLSLLNSLQIAWCLRSVHANDISRNAAAQAAHLKTATLRWNGSAVQLAPLCPRHQKLAPALS